jgi:hypothetical protein
VNKSSGSADVPPHLGGDVEAAHARHGRDVEPRHQQGLVAEGQDARRDFQDRRGQADPRGPDQERAVQARRRAAAAQHQPRLDGPARDVGLHPDGPPGADGHLEFDVRPGSLTQEGQFQKLPATRGPLAGQRDELHVLGEAAFHQGHRARQLQAAHGTAQGEVGVGPQPQALLPRQQDAVAVHREVEHRLAGGELDAALGRERRGPPFAGQGHDAGLRALHLHARGHAIEGRQCIGKAQLAAGEVQGAARLEPAESSPQGQFPAQLSAGAAQER